MLRISNTESVASCAAEMIEWRKWSDKNRLSSNVSQNDLYGLDFGARLSQAIYIACENEWLVVMDAYESS